MAHSLIRRLMLVYRPFPHAATAVVAQSQTMHSHAPMVTCSCPIPVPLLVRKRRALLQSAALLRAAMLTTMVTVVQKRTMRFLYLTVVMGWC